MRERSLKVNALLNITRQGMSIIFPFFTFPYVSRILGTTEFGRYNFSNSIVSYFALLAAFGLANFSVREGARMRDDRKKISKFASELFSFNLITTIVALVLLCLVTIFNSKLNIYASLIFVQSLSIILTTIGLDWVNTVYEDYVYITLRYIIIQFISLVMIFLFVKSSEDTIIYCLILLFGSYGGNIVNLFYIRKYVDVKLTLKIPYRKIFIPLLILFVNSLAVTIYVNSDITILGMYASDNEVGIYSFAAKIYNILKYLINAAIVVAIPRLTAIYSKNREQYREHLSKIFKLLIMLLIPLATGLAMLSDSIILLVGGSEYLAGNNSLKLLSISIVFALLSSVYVNGMMIISRQEKRTLIGTGVSATINVIGNFLLIPYIGMVGAAITTVIAEGVNFVLQRFFSKKYVLNVKFVDRSSLICAIFGGLITFIVCYHVNISFIGTKLSIVIIRIALAIILSFLGYALAIFILKFKDIKTFFK